LPTNLEVETTSRSEPIEGQVGERDICIPRISIKEHDTLPTWSEGVKLQVHLIRLITVIGAFWNIRGLNKSGGIKCIA
jgi:hypothetical protein